MFEPKREIEGKSLDSLIKKDNTLPSNLSGLASFLYTSSTDIISSSSSSSTISNNKHNNTTEEGEEGIITTPAIPHTNTITTPIYQLLTTPILSSTILPSSTTSSSTTASQVFSNGRIGTKEELKDRLRYEKQQSMNQTIDKLKATYDPSTDPNITNNAFCTLFVGRLSYQTTEKTLIKEFERYGTIIRARIVRDKEGTSRGYGFIEFDNENDVKVAFRQANHSIIDGKKIICDVERGRTVRGWLPRRLGGGVGIARPTLLPKEIKKSADYIYPPIRKYINYWIVN